MKIRLDQLLLKHNLAENILTARALIGAGKVLVNDEVSDKAGSLFKSDVNIRVKKAKCPYVSRGGLKLEAGLAHFGIDIIDKICLDVGASSGGFTDCLLKRGAAKVYAVDVAYGQLDWKLRQDPRVIVIERFNARKLTTDQIDQCIDLAVFDASFISLTKLIPIVFPFFKKECKILALIKPQFELPKKNIDRGGVVKDPQFHEQALDMVKSFALCHGLKEEGIVPSPLLGPKGNKEFLIYLTGNNEGG